MEGTRLSPRLTSSERSAKGLSFVECTGSMAGAVPPPSPQQGLGPSQDHKRTWMLRLEMGLRSLRSCGCPESQGTLPQRLPRSNCLKGESAAEQQLEQLHTVSKHLCGNQAVSQQSHTEGAPRQKPRTVPLGSMWPKVCCEHLSGRSPHLPLGDSENMWHISHAKCSGGESCIYDE